MSEFSLSGWCGSYTHVDDENVHVDFRAHASNTGSGGRNWTLVRTKPIK